MNCCYYSIAYKVAIHHPEHQMLKKFNHQIKEEEEYGKGRVNVIDSVYVISLEVGQQQVYLVFDIESYFIWVQHASCDPCLVERPPITRNDYNGSRNLQYLGCSMNTTNPLKSDCQYAKNTPGESCQNGVCSFQVGYKDGSGSSGKVGTDIFTPFTDKTMSQTMVFGIGFDNQCYPLYSCYQGVAGFGAGPLTLHSQLTSHPTRWGFCLPYNASMDGTLLVGDDAQIPGDYKRTRIYNSMYFYVTNLTDIFVEDMGKLTTHHATSMILIDTGATIIKLEDGILDNLVLWVRFIVNMDYNANPILSPYPGDLELCYDQPYRTEITLHLGEVFFTLSYPRDLWWEYPSYNAYCLSFRRTDEGNLNTLGNYHMRGHMVVMT
ncbi:aspartic proteinase nepenthesin-1-like [Silene latifolia]|uniref:aspartic proteinase nepenthesin-1-like n=1 Tax=Silene latifolia TaxID=37657 RepID=UPI003D77D0E1